MLHEIQDMEMDDKHQRPRGYILYPPLPDASKTAYARNEDGYVSRPIRNKMSQPSVGGKR